MSRCKRIIDIVVWLSKNGILDELYNEGFVTTKTIIYRDMFLKYDSYIRQGFQKKESRQKVAQFFSNCDERTVSRAIQAMKKPRKIA